MTRLTPWNIWAYRGLYLGLALAIMVFRLLPLGPIDGAFVGPDLILALTIAWLLRQPVVVPITLVVIVFLLADFLLQRPPGLMTALVLVTTEFLRNRRTALTEINFAVEWAWVAGAIVFITLAERFVLWLLLAPQTSLGLSLVQMLSTVIAYPLVVLISYFVLRLRRLRSVDAENS